MMKARCNLYTAGEHEITHSPDTVLCATPKDRNVNMKAFRVAQKLAFLYALTMPNINRFSKLFQCQNQEKTCNNTIIKDPTKPRVCRYTTVFICCAFP